MAIALSYKKAKDGMLYPNISFEAENVSELGKYGLMAMDYLKENYYERYMSLVRFNRLIEVLKPENEEAHRMVEQMVDKYMKIHKPRNPKSTMEMCKIRKQGLMIAEEIVIHELINTYH